MVRSSSITRIDGLHEFARLSVKIHFPHCCHGQREFGDAVFRQRTRGIAEGLESGFVVVSAV